MASLCHPHSYSHFHGISSFWSLFNLPFGVELERAIPATTHVWTAWFFSLAFFVGGVHGSFMGIIGLIAAQFSLFLICTYAFYKSDSIAGQIFLLGVVVVALA